ncbi:MAG: hypothetical protein JW982_17140 [Spirochaetes bacterium]|nr:hypothetical protein [Spirochaetota bacterium]
MKDLMNKEGREFEVRAEKSESQIEVEAYRRMISDVNYLDHAIKKIATDLSHYLTK